MHRYEDIFTYTLSQLFVTQIVEEVLATMARSNVEDYGVEVASKQDDKVDAARYDDPASIVDEKHSADSRHEIGLDLYQEGYGVDTHGLEARKVLKKIDWWILPIFCALQGFSFLDKTALNFGNLWGMKKSLHVDSAQYSWFASGFYLSYLVCTYPMTLVLQKYHTGKVLGALAFVWGIVCACMAVCHNFSGALMTRIILGALECAVTPGLGLMTPIWWTLAEQPVRLMTWYSMNGWFDIVGSFISYGLGHVTETTVRTWQLIFIIFGSLTSFLGIYMFFYLPDSPVTAKFLSHDQKVLAVKRVSENRTGVKNTAFKRHQFVEAFKDPKMYLLFLASISAQIPNGVVTNFGSIIIKSFGFNNLQTTLLGIPDDAVQIISLIGSGWVASRWKNTRAIMMFIGNATCIVGTAVVTYAPKDQRILRLIFYYLHSFQSVGFAMGLVMISANVAGETKRRTIQGTTFIGYCIGNIAGPHVLLDREAKEGYPTATKAMMGGYSAKTFFHLCLGLYMWYWNKRWDREARERGEIMSNEERLRRAEEVGMRDATEFENPYFRYAL
ncbi:major facilitator superfamily domain-containing protein [Kockovaella imperatae]|uniref:Major facilitator superfamily domain-containing protein n=1 Tax=Kockovaella imperatae TaxID=4999 RepID=A0A1Y1UQB6_9TREE|nr:major facilitator superfamily domain-containing protein [Kockovaella imperatae]ORX40258.1 major facilitator superfamily domain-containing protein [Kockovaella imperatae]